MEVAAELAVLHPVTAVTVVVAAVPLARTELATPARVVPVQVYKVALAGLAMRDRGELAVRRTVVQAEPVQNIRQRPEVLRDQAVAVAVG